MAIIKFDSEKANALIRDLATISSDIDSNFTKVYNNSYGKEINLGDSRLKVYDWKTVTNEVVQEDGTVVTESKSVQYLKHDYTANARIYNKHIRNIYTKSNSAKTNATKSIEKVINSLNKIKSLISEYESDYNLKMSNSLDDVGQFNFNFLAAYGSMGKPQNYSNSFGTIVADDAYTSLHLGVLGQRPTSINLEKLEVFDGMLEIARSNSLSYQEKIEKVQNLLMDNVPNVDHEDMMLRTKNALESMINVANSPDVVIDDNLKIEKLVKIGVPVIEDYDGDLAIDIKNVEGVFGTSIMLGKTLINDNKNKSDEINLDIDGKEKTNVDFGSGSGQTNDSSNEHKKMDSQLGLKSDVQLDAKTKKDSISSFNSGNKPAEDSYYKSTTRNDDNISSTNKGNNKQVGNDNLKKESAPKDNNRPSNNGKGIEDRAAKQANSKDTPQKEQIKPAAKINVGNNKPAPSVKDDIIENIKVEKPAFNEEIKQTSEDVAIDQEIQAVKIENNYKEINVTESTNADKVNIDIEDSTIKKGAGLAVGAASIGGLSKIGGNSSVDMPQVNGMAAGELLGINTGSDVASMGMIVGDTPGAAASTGNVTAPASTNTTVGGESTSDRGSLSNGSTTNKTNNNSVSGRGGATLEDKNEDKNENSFGKPNKPGETEEATKKGLLGDASIAELDEKDEKDIKVATGVTAATAVTSGVLAILNVFPWFMFLLALIAIGTYVGYRIKKKKDKEKRMAALAAKKAQDEANATVTMEAVQNVSDVVAPENAVVTETTEETVVEENAIVESQPVQSEVQTVQPESQNAQIESRVSGDEFSEQPYEPSRDGMTEIGGASNKTE